MAQLLVRTLRAVLFVFKLGGLLASLLLVTALTAWVTITLSFAGRDVNVPELVGMPPAKAGAVLSQVGLRLRTEGERHTDRAPAGIIFYQKPAAGTTLKRNRAVRVLVSLGSESRLVPRVAGKGLDEARGVLSGAGLGLGRMSHVHSREVPPDTVVAQHPVAGSRVTRSRRVDLLVSQGARKWRFVMPDLAGHPLDTVRDFLEEWGFQVGRVERRYVTGTRGGYVVGHFPPSGARVGQGTVVVLVVSEDLPVGASGRGKG